MKDFVFCMCGACFIIVVHQENIQIMRDLSLLQVQMRDLEGYRVRPTVQNRLFFACQSASF